MSRVCVERSQAVTVDHRGRTVTAGIDEAISIQDDEALPSVPGH